ncbi:MAG: NAD synthetase [Gammaproteobacteria bacterium]|nr:NAD synthetase [Gammaproteobacteria bacterium]
MRIALAQLNLIIGDIAGNKHKIIANTRAARDEHQADLIIFPELAITSYPPEDLLLRPKFLRLANEALTEIIQQSTGISLIVGHPELANGKIFNSLSYIRNCKIHSVYHKKDLPNYGVFDDKRYFTAGDAITIIDLDGVPTAPSICEDLWSEEHSRSAADAGARLLININASPFHSEIIEQRQALLRRRIKDTGLSIIYVNLVGGQDEVVFDGGSMVMNSSGELVLQAPQFEEGLFIIEMEKNANTISFKHIHPPLASEIKEESIYKALVLGVRDYVRKNGFKGAVIGLSGGIDSALTMAIAADALGPDNIEVLLMPSRFTAVMSIDDSIVMAETLGVAYHIVSIEKPFQSFTEILTPLFAGLPADATEENIQARCRGVLLMAISNKTGKLVLTTGNKSEMAVGYATLYGDMAGGFAPLKDVSKTLVYRLAHWRNRQSPVIPERIITRAPSAELRPDQKDEDSLPPYHILDAILEKYIEMNQSPEEIIAAGYTAQTVYDVARMVDRNEYKRRQAAPGVKISRRAFGRDRRYPITSAYKEI